MGYRSDLAGCFSVDKNDKEKFKQMIGFIKLSKFYELFVQQEETDAFGWADGKFVMYGRGWKWYQEYEDVKAWNELWEQMEKMEGISGYFVRVGESTDDIEELSFGDDPPYDEFHAFSALSFDAGYILSKRETDEEGQTTQDASVASA